MALRSFIPPPGTLIDDKFLVESVLGKGAMGTVLRARHLQLDVAVALKFLDPERSADPVTLERFSREAKAAARLTSEYATRVLDVGTSFAGAPYIVMEHLVGHTLLEVLARRGSLPVDEACRYVSQICEALSEAHGLGIIHRDLKLANLFVVSRPSGETMIKILDFGVSKVDLADSEDLTQTRVVLGTPQYMAPEQIVCSREVDARADLYSCGVCLYRMLTGSLPFPFTSLAVIAEKQRLEEMPALRSLRPEIPGGLQDVVARCLRPDPVDRWPSAAALQAALLPYLGSDEATTVADVVAKPASAANGARHGRGRAGIVALGIALAGLAVLLANARGRETISAPPVVGSSAAVAVGAPETPPAKNAGGEAPFVAAPPALTPSTKPRAARPPAPPPHRPAPSGDGIPNER